MRYINPRYLLTYFSGYAHVFGICTVLPTIYGTTFRSHCTAPYRERTLCHVLISVGLRNQPGSRVLAATVAETFYNCVGSD